MKRAPRLDRLPLSLDAAATTPLWRQLSIGLQLALANGRLGPGARLPSTRELARQLHVSRNTVIVAYEDLTARGLVSGRTGAGSFVTKTPRRIRHVQVWFHDDSGTRLALSSLS